MPIQKLTVGEPVQFTIMDETQRVLLHPGGILTDGMLGQLKERGTQYITAEIIEQEHELVAPLDVSPEIKEIALGRLEDALDKLSMGKTVSIEPVQDSVQKISREIMNHHELVIPIAQLKRYDDYTYVHSLNVTIMALIIGKYLDFTESTMITLGMGAMFHDLGKLNIPLNILGKPEKLTKQEFQTIKQHPVFAKKILEERTSLSDEVQQVVFQHHEKMNGSGYPLGINLRGINPLAAIVSVVDIFEALTSNRPYRKPLSIPDALEYLMSHAGYTLDEIAVKTFIRHLSPYRIGLMVLLSSGEYAEITTINHFVPFRPTVKIIDSHDKPGSNPPKEIDLSRNLSVTILRECEDDIR